VFVDELNGCSDAVEISVEVASFVFDGVKFHILFAAVSGCRPVLFFNFGAKVLLFFDICKLFCTFFAFFLYFLHFRHF